MTARATEQRNPRLTPQQRAYIRKLDEIARRLVGLEDETIRRMVGSLQQLRKEIAAELLTVDPDSFSAHRLTQTKRNVADITARFEATLAAQMRPQFGAIYEAGGLMVVEPLQAAGISGVFYRPDVARLNVILDFSADLIKDITGDIQGRIETQITRSLLGQQTPFKAMQEITNILGARASDGIWGRRRRPEVVKGVAARAEAILRTEMTRAANLAHHSQQLVNAELEPEIRKRWMATGDNRTRRSHLRTHIATLEEPIPVGQAFDVGGFKLMFPGDPAGPPGETINCRCRVITVHPEIGQVETTTDRKVKEVRSK